MVRIGIVTQLASMGLVGSAAAQHDWLAIMGDRNAVRQSISSKSGIGTANAAEAKATRKDAEDWCRNWQPEANLEVCVKEQLASESGQTVRATADCRAGPITATNGNSYTFAGV